MIEERKLNIELLTKVRDKIATTPGAYDQEVFARETSRAPCGTAACIAGWACVLSGEMDTAELIRRGYGQGEVFQSIADTAERVLGLSSEESETLFTQSPEGERDEDDEDEVEGGWPEPFRDRWEEATRRERPNIAVAYLDHIIQTGRVTE